MSAMMVQIHVGTAPEIAASVVICGIGGAILFISLSEIANLIRMGMNRCRKKKIISVEGSNNPTRSTSQTIVPLDITETFEEKKDTSMDM